MLGPTERFIRLQVREVRATIENTVRHIYAHSVGACVLLCSRRVQ